MREKCVLIVSSEFPPQPGGIGNHAYHLAKHLNNCGYFVTVLVDARSQPEREEAFFDAQQNFSVKRISVTKPRGFMYLRRLYHFYQLSKTCDFIMASGKFSLWLVGLTTWYHKKQCTAIIHGTEVNLHQKLARNYIEKALQNFDSIVAVSNYTKQLVAHLNLRTISVIPNGFDAQLWQPIKTLKENVKGFPNLITVGRLSERKGQEQVIKHLPYIIKRYPNVHYHCVGIDYEKEHYIHLAKSLGVEKYVTIHGVLRVEKLIKLLCQCDIKVMLSGESKSGDVEGFGIAILEANALGVPTIGSKNSGIADAIKHGKSGLLIEALDHKVFIEAIDSVLNKKEMYSLEAIKWAQKHRWEVIIKSYLEVIENS